MKHYLILVFILSLAKVAWAQGFDYDAVLKGQVGIDAKRGLEKLLKGRKLSDVIAHTTPEARDTLTRYNRSLVNAHLSGPYTVLQFDGKLLRAHVNVDAGLKKAAGIVANGKLPYNRRIAALQIMFGLNKLIYQPMPVYSIAPRDEFVKNDILVSWNDHFMYNTSRNSIILYNAYKLGLRLAQSRGNEQLTNYFLSKVKPQATSWMTGQLTMAFYIPPKIDSGQRVMVENPNGDPRTFLPGESEPVYDLNPSNFDIPGVNSKFSIAYNQYYNIIYSHLEYPEEEWNRGIEGEVGVSFVVEKDGSITHLKTGDGLTPGTDSAAMRVAKYLPKFIPGKLKSGETVRTFNSYLVGFIIMPGIKREDAFKAMIKK